MREIFNFFVFIRCFKNKLINKFYFLFYGIELGKNWNINGIIYVRNNGKILIGDNFNVNSGINYNTIGGDIITRLITTNEGNLKIGDGVGISNSTIFCFNNIEIKDHVYIGGGCKIWDSDFHSLNPIERIHLGDNNVNSLPILIEEYVFIGASSIILKGVKIGRNSIIGAGSVVTKDVPSNEIWAGNPAIFIKSIV